MAMEIGEERSEPNELMGGSDHAAFYKLLSLIILSGSALMLWHGITISSELVPVFLLAASLPFVFRLLLPRYGNPKTSGAVECIGLLYIQGGALFLLLVPLATVSLPFADQQIAYFDGLFGFHWPSFVSLFGPNAYVILKFLYGSFAWQPLVIMPLLWSSGHGTRAWQAVTAATLAALICALVFPLVPARGPAVYYGLEPADYPLLSGFAWWFGPAIETFKSGQVSEITPELLFPMVSVPSYHTVAALLFTWAVWPLRLARAPFFVLNAGMLVATIVVGTHYLTDVLAGGVLTGMILLLLKYRKDPEIRC